VYDLTKLGKLKDLGAAAPEVSKAFWAFDKAAMPPGAISGKNKELIALAVAFTTQCPYAFHIHAGRARDAGATDQEIARDGRCNGCAKNVRNWTMNAAVGQNPNSFRPER